MVLVATFYTGRGVGCGHTAGVVVSTDEVYSGRLNWWPAESVWGASLHCQCKEGEVSQVSRFGLTVRR